MKAASLTFALKGDSLLRLVGLKDEAKKEILFDTRHLIYIKYSNSLHDLSMHAVELSQHCWIVGWRPSPGGATSPQTLIVHLVDLCLLEWCVRWPAEALKKGSYFPLSSW